jgi:hypothetical protein
MTSLILVLGLVIRLVPVARILCPHKVVTVSTHTQGSHCFDVPSVTFGVDPCVDSSQGSEDLASVVQCVLHALDLGSDREFEFATLHAGLECLAALAHALPDPVFVLQQLRKFEAQLARDPENALVVQNVLREAKVALQARAVRLRMWMCQSPPSRSP